MHYPSSKFITHQVWIGGDWYACDADKPATAAAPRRRLYVMPDYEIVAKRWQNREGQTYHSVSLYDISKNSYELIGHAPFTHGYGDQWQTTAVKLVLATLPDLFNDESRSTANNGAVLRDDWNIACSVSDVDRKKDM